MVTLTDPPTPSRARIPGSTVGTLGLRQAAVVAHLRDHPGLTAGELARVFGLRGSLMELLRRLEQHAQVVAVPAWEPHQGRRVHRWQVAPPGTIPAPRPSADPETLRRRRERDRLSQRARRAWIRGLAVQPGMEAPSLRTRPAVAVSLPGAACRTADPGLFFGPDGERAKERRRREARATAVCAGCPVRAACYVQAVANRERHGVWGGVSFETETGEDGKHRELTRTGGRAVTAAAWPPALADLEAATARTAAAIADPAASLADVERAAEAEEAIYQACPDWPSPEADAELEAG